MSDHLGRKATYYTFFLLGIVLYASAPWLAHTGSKALFVLAFGIIMSMYGGGFATIPAYLADVFGTQFVGAIHGRLLTAWSTAGIVGPVVVNYIREFEIKWIARESIYDVTTNRLRCWRRFYLQLFDQDAHKWFMKDEVAALQARSQMTIPVVGRWASANGALMRRRSWRGWRLASPPGVWLRSPARWCCSSNGGKEERLLVIGLCTRKEAHGRNGPPTVHAIVAMDLAISMPSRGR